MTDAGKFRTRQPADVVPAMTKDEHDELVARRKRNATDEPISRRNVAPVVDITRRTLLDEYTSGLGGDAA